MQNRCVGKGDNAHPHFQNYASATPCECVLSYSMIWGKSYYCTSSGLVLLQSPTPEGYLTAPIFPRVCTESSKSMENSNLGAVWACASYLSVSLSQQTMTACARVVIADCQEPIGRGRSKSLEHLRLESANAKASSCSRKLRSMVQQVHSICTSAMEWQWPSGAF